MDDLKIAVNNYVPTNISEALKKYNGYLAGGCLVSLFLNLPVNDMDIFVSMEYGLEMYHFLLKNGYKPVMVKYFEVEKYSLTNSTFCRILLIKDNYKIDLVITKTDPSICVKSFDLSCCQIWFDGEDIDGTHLPEFFNKISYILIPPIPGDKRHLTWWWRERQRKYVEKGFQLKKDLSKLSSFHKVPEYIELTSYQNRLAKMYKEVLSPIKGPYDP